MAKGSVNHVDYASKMIPKPLFIAFEGLDGSGTTTQTHLLAEHLRKSGQPSVVTAEPSDGPVGSLIRLALKRRICLASSGTDFDTQMAYLFAADRNDHLHNEHDGVLALIQRGIHVISARYYFSSLAYHVSDNRTHELVVRLNQDFPAPDVTIYIDIPVSEALRRIGTRKHVDVYETESKLSSVSQRYQTIWSTYKGKLVIVDGTESVDSVGSAVWNKVRELIAPCP